MWELLPQYVMPLLVGVSVFCLSNRDSLLFTTLFGGANGNEGLGFLASSCSTLPANDPPGANFDPKSLSFDWQFITTTCFYYPLQALSNAFLGYLGCIVLFMAIYYGNVWDAMRFPFLSQQLFSSNSSAQAFDIYNQSVRDPGPPKSNLMSTGELRISQAILDAQSELDRSKLEQIGLPFFATTNAAYLLTTNLGVTAAITHIALFNRDTLRHAFDFSSLVRFFKSPRSLFEKGSGPEHEETDPHYRLMLAYKEVPSWWYLLILVGSTAAAIGCIYALGSTLPWWGFVVAVTLSFLGTLFFGSLSGIFGFQVPITSVIQLLGGYLHPGKPVANMYFVLFGANAQSQALNLVGSLKLGQYGKLSPRCTFV